MTTTVDSQTLQAIVGDADAFPWQFDPVQRRMLFLRLTQDIVRGASFLDERLGTQGRDGFWLPLESLAELAALGNPPKAPAYIFHIGHCGSTLLTRMLEQVSNVQALREPMVLRTLAMAASELESPLSRLSVVNWSDLLRAVARLLGRRFARDQPVLVKATSTCNNLIEPLLSELDDARIIFLHIPLESYLATMLKGAGGGLDGLHGAPARLQFLHARLGDDSMRLHQMDHAQILAMGWLAELARFQEIEKIFSTSQQIMHANFEDILVEPERHAAAIADHLHLPRRQCGIAALKDSKVMAGYAKSPEHAYTIADRNHDLDLSRRRFATQIAQGMQWAEHTIKRHSELHALESHLR